MAKKKTTRRPNLSQETLERARAERRSSDSTDSAPVVASSGSSGAKIKRAGTPISAATRLPSTEELSREYSHVMKDLRALLILSVLLLIGILALAVILPHPNV